MPSLNSLWTYTMNRCLRSALASVLLTTALLALAITATAQEAVRPFPAAAKRATLQVTYPPDILLNGQAARLSPGARIRGVNNMLVLSGSLAGQTLLVNYVKDAQGLVHEVWVLNNTEAQQKREGASLPPNYVSDAVTASGEAGSTGAATSSTQP
jgi:hypothetical protein